MESEPVTVARDTTVTD